MSLNIHWPSREWEPRDGQKELLEATISSSDSWDVCVIEAPTAWGKTICSKALLTWASKELKMKGMLLEPNNMLVAQVRDSYGLPSLLRKDEYKCTEFKGWSCSQAKAKNGGHCKGCPYTNSLRKIRAVPYGVLSYHMYMAHKFKHPFLILDEAHNILPTLQDLAGRKIWHSTYRFPLGARTTGQLREWLAKCPGYQAGFPNDPLLTLLHETLESTEPAYLIELGEELLRGRPEALIKLLPVSVKNMPPILWPQAKKLILMSATISRVDVEELGLAHKRILYLKAPSPIPIERRPIRYVPLGSMSYASQEANLPRLVAFLKELIERHKGEKGLIHITYSLKDKLLPHFKGQPNVLFHSQYDKRDVFKGWTERTDGAVLFGCGMHEGLDLVEELGRWQAIVKVPWPSLGDTAVRWKMEQNQEWYNWQAIKLVAQAVGRICRTPSDYGTTYILDSSWERLKDNDLVPSWMRQAYCTTEPGL